MPERQEVEIISERKTGGALSFFLPDEIDTALRQSGFTVGEQIELLVDSIRNAENVWARLAAMRFFDNKIEKSLVLSGAVRTLEGRKVWDAGDGTQNVLESKSMTLLDRAAQHTEVLESLPPPEEELDVIEVNDEGFSPEVTEENVGENARSDPASTEDAASEYLSVYNGHKPPASTAGGLS